MSHTISGVLGEATVQERRDAVRGRSCRCGDDGYADAPRIWSGAHDGRSPALVARCAERGANRRESFAASLLSASRAPTRTNQTKEG
jgi:hypothetical protein